MSGLEPHETITFEVHRIIDNAQGDMRFLVTTTVKGLQPSTVEITTVGDLLDHVNDSI